MASSKQLIKITAEQWIPWTLFNVDDKGEIQIGGPMGKLLQVFTKYMNFEYELVLSEGGGWGNRLPDGNWTGMMGLVFREEVEFSLGPFTHTHEREEAADLSVEVHRGSKKLLMVRPGLENDISGLLKPFTPTVWLLILASLISTSVAMMFMVWVEDKIFEKETKHIISKASLWIIQTISQESSEWLPSGDGGRIIVSTWLLASLIFMSSYSGILIAMLTVPRVTIPIDSLYDLVNQNKLPWRLESGSMMRPFLKNSDDETRRKAYYGMSGSYPDCWTTRNDVANGEYAVICDEFSMKKMMSWDFGTNEQCHMYIAREAVYANTMVAVAFRRNSSFLPKANKLITIVRETGIFAKWMREAVTNATECLKPPTSDRQDGIQPLSINVIYGPLILLLGGWTLGVQILMCELGIHWNETPSV